MGQHTLLICRSQTEAVGVYHHLKRMGIHSEVTQPPRRLRTESCGWAVRVHAGQSGEALRQLRLAGISPCRVLEETGGGI
ncbi:MAG: putative Se/S carrier-like protein [Agathobaculum sp.]|jgi:hypothetical protein|uniref:putative Se/S carrier-like protein n=1 Tax=Agathobaculum sp. TaxID=2048138 RepID=UPI003D8B1AEF